MVASIEVITAHHSTACSVSIYFFLLFRRIFRSSKKKIILFISLLSMGLNVDLARGRLVRWFHREVHHCFPDRMLGIVVRPSLCRDDVASTIRTVLAAVISHIPDNLL